MPAPLYAPAALRAWLHAGLSHVLLDSEERLGELKIGPSFPGASANKPGDRGEQKRSLPQTGGPLPSARRFQSDDGPHALNRKPGVPTAAAAQDGAPSPRPVDANGAPPDPSPNRILPPEAWPPAWVALKNRRPLPPRPVVVWTYAGLGEDLMGTADPARQQVMVRMLTALRHPGGTHVFWPYELPASPASGETSGDNAPSLFWSGVAMLKPRVLLLFGSEARDALNLPKSLVPYGQMRVAGRLVIQLPRPSALSGMSSEPSTDRQTQEARGDDAFRRALAFLARLLQFCASRG